MYLSSYERPLIEPKVRSFCYIYSSPLIHFADRERIQTSARSHLLELAQDGQDTRRFEDCRP
jgi:hypothetical protein